MTEQNLLFGMQLLGILASGGAALGTMNLRKRANDRDLQKACEEAEPCGGHPIEVRSEVHEKAQAAVPLILAAGFLFASPLVAAGSLAVASGSVACSLLLRYEFIKIDDERCKTNNDKAGIIRLDYERASRRKRKSFWRQAA